jgi:FimV-like protein
MRIIKVCVLILSFLPSFVYGIGFGEIKVYSYHNEPFDAEIELMDTETVEPEQLVVNLGSVQEFKQVALTRPTFWPQLHFEVNRQANRTFIKVSTRQAVKHSSLIELLIHLSSPKGRLSRGYTVLLEHIPAGRAISISERRAAFAVKRLEMINTRMKRPEHKPKTILSNPETLKLDANILSAAFTFNPPHLNNAAANGSERTGILIEQPTLYAQTFLQVPLILREARIEATIPEDAIMIAPLAQSSNTPPTAIPLQSTFLTVFSFTSRLNQILRAGLAITGTLLCIVLAMLVLRRKKMMKEQKGYKQSESHASNAEKYAQDYFSEADLREVSATALFSEVQWSAVSPPGVIPDTSLIQEESFKLTTFPNEIKLKLELALQYLEIGDQDNALYLFEEVLLYGNQNEKEQAQKLIANLETKYTARGGL